MKSFFVSIALTLAASCCYGVEIISSSSHQADGKVSYEVCVLEAGDVPSLIIIFEKKDLDLVVQQILHGESKISNGGLVKDKGEWYYVSSKGDEHEAFHLDFDHLKDEIAVKTVDLSDARNLARFVIDPRTQFDTSAELSKMIKKKREQGKPVEND